MERFLYVIMATLWRWDEECQKATSYENIIWVIVSWPKQSQNHTPYFQGFIYSIVVRYIRFTLEECADISAVRSNAPLWFRTSRIRRTSLMELIWYGREMINYIIAYFLAQLFKSNLFTFSAMNLSWNVGVVNALQSFLLLDFLGQAFNPINWNSIAAKSNPVYGKSKCLISRFRTCTRREQV